MDRTSRKWLYAVITAAGTRGRDLNPDGQKSARRNVRREEP